MLFIIFCLLFILYIQTMIIIFFFFFFFFKQKTAYEIPLCDWSSDVCSSDLTGGDDPRRRARPRVPRGGDVRRKPGASAQVQPRVWKGAERAAAADRVARPLQRQRLAEHLRAIIAEAEAELRRLGRYPQAWRDI